MPDPGKITVIRNKIDLVDQNAGINEEAPYPVINLSARSGQGVSQLKEHLKAVMGFNASTDSTFTARQRHLDALHRSRESLSTGLTQLRSHGAGELLAEDLRTAHDALGEITGKFTPDDLLGKIFSSFCIGK